METIRTGASLKRLTRFSSFSEAGSFIQGSARNFGKCMIPLGFNYPQMHDSSACIARDGELLFAVAEERISRVKHDAGFPRHAIRACLDFAKVRPDQLDFVCQGWPAPSRVFAADLKCFLRGQYPITYMNVLSSARLYASMAHQNGGFERFQV